MKNNKILFFDIDGTLLDEHTLEIPDSTITALKRAKENGHIIIINTGRPKSTLAKFIFDLNPDGLVCGCGTYVEFKGNTLYHNTLDSKRCKEIVDALDEYKIDAILEGKNHIYFTNNITHPDLLGFKKQSELKGFETKSLLDSTIVFDKFAMWFNKDVDLIGFKNTINDFQYIVRDVDFGEIVPKHCSKATGIQVLLDHLNLSIDDSYCFGDSSNDLPMLEYAGTSIVMGNAKDELKSIASFVTKDVNQDGIMFAMESLDLI